MQTNDVIRQSNYILIQHIGVSSKPILTVLISDENLVEESYKIFCYQTNKKDYSSLENVMYAYKTDNDIGGEFGSFRIQIFVDREKKMEATLNRDKSILLFDKSIKVLKKGKRNEALLTRLKRTKEIIDY
jgi:hypothetical protein